MVSSIVVDAVSSPSNTLNELYSEWRKEGSPDQFSDRAFAHFSSIFANEELLDHIPSLDMNLPSGSLVRFAAMVQDTSCSPELYASSYRNGQILGGWGLDDDLDAIGAGSETDYSALKERSIIWAVNIPGLAPWVGSVLPGDQSTRIKFHKIPIRRAPGVAVQIKAYHSTAENLKPTDLVNLVGILSMEPEHSEIEENTVPVPTLHVLFHRPLPNTIIPRVYPSTNDRQDIRHELLTWVAEEAFGNDRHAAEWALLSCISSVQSRNPPMLPMSLTISQFKNSGSRSDGALPTFVHVLEELCPTSSYVPLSLKLLNEERFAPESINEDLHAGSFQIPQGSTVLVSDFDVAEGQVSERGVRNLSALQEIVNQQTLRYDFPFSQYSFPTDINVIVLTEGRKSAFCETNVVVPLFPESGSNLLKARDVMRIPDDKSLSAFRELIGGARSGKTTVSEDLSKQIQTEFVEERKKDTTITQEDLIRRMTIARLMALSRHDAEISGEVWSLAKAFDNERTRRCKEDR